MDEAERTELAAIAAGDVGVFTEWLAEAEPRVRASLARFARAVDVESVVQETLLRAWQVAPRVQADGRGESLIRVAIRVARNLAVDELRRDGARTAREESAGGDAEPAEPSLPDPFLRERLDECRQALPKTPRRALEARLEAVAARPADIAASLGMRANTYLQNLARARRFLVACLEGLGVEVEEVLR